VNPQYLTPEILRLMARKIMVPLALVLVFGGGIYYAIGELEEKNARLQFAIDARDWDITETDQRIATIDEELGVIREKGRRYDQILLTGFVEPQDRLLANQLVEELSRKHQLAALTYSFNPELVREVNGESGVQYLLSRTEISIDLKAYTDYDVAGFTADFVRSLEGQVQIESMSISRNEPITSESIQRVATDASTGSFTGTLRLSWNNARTVTPDEEDQP
jgi:hypothetical protein